MEIIVLSKQVKMGDTVKCDFAGVEAAIRLKKKTYAHISIYVMGEEASGIAQVRDSIAMGADNGTVLVLNNSENLDSWTTAKIFADQIKDENYDLILSGSFPIDADTIQTGLLTGNMLNLSSISHIEDIEPLNEGSVKAAKRMEDRLQMIEVKLPCMMSTLPHPEAPIYKTVAGINRAYSQEIPVIQLDLMDQKGKIKVEDSFKIGERKRGTCLTLISTEEAAKAVINKISENHIL